MISESFGVLEQLKRAELEKASSMRHAKSSTMLDHYAQTDMDELIKAQEMILDAIFSHSDGSELSFSR